MQICPDNFNDGYIYRHNSLGTNLLILKTLLLGLTTKKIFTKTWYGQVGITVKYLKRKTLTQAKKNWNNFISWNVTVYKYRGKIKRQSTVVRMNTILLFSSSPSISPCPGKAEVSLASFAAQALNPWSLQCRKGHEEHMEGLWSLLVHGTDCQKNSGNFRNEDFL